MSVPTKVLVRGMKRFVAPAVLSATVALGAAAEVTHTQGISTDRHPYRVILEHHRSLLRFAVRSSVGWRKLLLPVVVVGAAVRTGLACLARFREG